MSTRLTDQSPETARPEARPALIRCLLYWFAPLRSIFSKRSEQSEPQKRKRLLIFAGNEQEAVQYATERGDSFDFIWARNRWRIVGLYPADFETVLTGSWDRNEEVIDAYEFWKRQRPPVGAWLEQLRRALQLCRADIQRTRR